MFHHRRVVGFFWVSLETHPSDTHLGDGADFVLGEIRVGEGPRWVCRIYRTL